MWKKIFKRLATHYVINGTYVSKEYDDGCRYSFPLQSDFLALYFSKIYYILINYWARKNNLILREHKDFLEEILESEPEVPGFLYQFNEENIKLGESLLKEYEEGRIGFEKVQRKKIGKWKRLWKNLTLSI